MIGLRAVLAFVSLRLLGSSQQHLPREDETPEPHPIPTGIGASAEELALLLDVRPTSLLIVDLRNGPTLTLPRPMSSLLLSYPKTTERIPQTRSRTNTELLDALAAPLKVVLITSRQDCLNDRAFYRSDFTQNIRHKFLFLVFQRAANQTWDLLTIQATLRIRTLIWTEDEAKRFFCSKNHDNLFAKRYRESPRECTTSAASCAVLSTQRSIPNSYGPFKPEFSVRVRCNVTEFENNFFVERVRLRGDPMRAYLTSSWGLQDTEPEGCFSYILVDTVDVTALLKAFQPGVWCLILATAIIVAALWSRMRRRPTLPILGRILQSTITVRDIGPVLAPKTYSQTAVGCTAIAFIFFIGNLYSNCVMTSFLDPTVEPRTSNFYFCHLSHLCSDARNLQIVLEHVPVCALPQTLLSGIGKPLRRFQAEKDHFQGTFDILETGKKEFDFGAESEQLPLAVTQKSIIVDRLLCHGLISSKQLRLLELTRRGRNSRSVTLLRVEAMSRITGILGGRKLGPEIATYNTTLGQFDMNSFWEMRSLFGVCLLFNLGVWALEWCCPRLTTLSARVRVRTEENYRKCQLRFGLMFAVLRRAWRDFVPRKED